MASPANAARLDAATHRLRGFSWSEHTGWINLDHADVFVGVFCPADYNQSGMVRVQDIFDFLVAYFGGC